MIDEFLRALVDTELFNALDAVKPGKDELLETTEDEAALEDDPLESVTLVAEAPKVTLCDVMLDRLWKIDGSVLLSELVRPLLELGKLLVLELVTLLELTTIHR